MSQIWLVTGAARGLGLGITRAALEAGHSVVATTRGQQPAGLQGRYPDTLLVETLDVSDPDQDQFQRVVKAAVDRFARIDVLVNNAGYGLLTHFEETEEAQIRAEFETNVFGLMRMTRSVLPVMRQQRSGHVMTVASVAGYATGTHGSIYAATKFAVTGFAETLSKEVGRFGIRVTNVAPGLFRTDFFDESSVQHDCASRLADYDDARAGITASLQRNHQQPGDPAALGRLLVEVAALDEPPLHLPVGADAAEGISVHHTRVLAEVDTWKERVSRTRFGDEPSW